MSDDLIPFDQIEAASSESGGELFSPATPESADEEANTVITQPADHEEKVKEEEEQGIMGQLGDAFADTGRALGRGIEDAGRGLIQTGAGLLGQEDPMKDVPHVFDKPKGIVNQIAKDVVQFGIGLVGGMRALEGIGVAQKLAPVAKEVAASAVGTSAVADPNADRLSNLVQNYPILENPITDFLAADPEDGIAEGKFKAALEDMLTSAVALPLFHGIRAMKLRSRGLDDSADLAAVEAHITKADEASGQTSFEWRPDLIDEPEVIHIPEVNVVAKRDENGQLSLFRDSSTDGIVREWKTSRPSKADAFAAFPGWSKEPRQQVAIADLTAGHGMDDEARVAAGVKVDEEAVSKKISDYEQRLAANPQNVPALVVERKVDGTLEVIDGHARLEAAKRRGLKSVPADVVMSPEAAKAYRGQIEKRIVENSRVIAENTKLQPSAEAAQPALVQVRNAKGEHVFSLSPERKQDLMFEVERSLKFGDDDVQTNALSGRINWNHVSGPEEMKAVLDTVTEAILPAYEKNAKGYQSFKSIKAAADYLGTDYEQAVGNLRTWGYEAHKIPATLIAGKFLANSLSSEIARVARSVYMGTGGESGRVELVRLMDALQEVQGFTQSIKTAAARTTAAGRIRTTPRYGRDELKGLLQELQGGDAVRNAKAGMQADIDRLASLITLAEGKPKDVLRLLQRTKFGKAIDAHNEIWINGILSGAATHVVNATSALTNTLLHPAVLVTGGVIRRDWNAVREGIAVYKGLRTFFFDSLELARKAFVTHRAVLDNNGTIDTATGAISARNYGLDESKWFGQAIDFLGNWIVRMPSRFLTAEDEFFKQMSYRSKLSAQLGREEADLLKAGKLKPSDAATWRQKRFDEAFTPEGRAADDRALDYARGIMFTQDLKAETWLGNKSFSESLQTLAAGHPLIRGTILPFVRVPANLTRDVVNFSPLAPLRKQFLSDIAAGGDKANMALGKLSLGSALWATAGLMVAEGMVTGAPPGDPEVRKRLTETGWQPYSFVFTNDDGTKTYVSYRRFDPYGTVFGLIADFAQISNSVDPKVRDSLATSMTLALANNISSKSYLKGLVEFTSMLGSGYSKEEIATRMINMRAASYVPNWSSAFMLDDELKNVRTPMDAIMAKIPGLSDNVPARRDYFGEKRLAPMGMPWTALDPFVVSQEKADPVRKELARLAMSEAEANFTTPQEKLGTLDLTQFKNAAGQTAHDRWTELIGQVPGPGGLNFHDRLKQVMESPRYKNGNDGTSAYRQGSRIVDIRTEQERYRQIALRQVLREFDDLKEAHLEDMRNKERVKHGKAPSPMERFLQEAR